MNDHNLMTMDGMHVRTNNLSVDDKMRLATAVFDKVAATSSRDVAALVRVAGHLEKEHGICGAVAVLGVYTANFTEGNA